MLLSLDPSSTAIGYALFLADARATLHSAGVIRPTRRRDGFRDRTHEMCSALLAVTGIKSATRAVIEFAGMYGRGKREIMTARVLGFAVGMAAAAVAELVPWGRIEFIEPREWTGNRSKAARTRLLAAELRGYDRKKDPGMDAADAIGLGRWWLAKHAWP